MGELIFGILTVVIIFSLLSSIERKQQQMLSERSGFTIEDFSAYFEDEGIPCDFSKKVYRYLQSLLGVKNVPILASDDLSSVLGIGRMGGVFLEDILEEVLEATPSRKLVGYYMENHGWSGKVDDLVKLLFFLLKEKNC